MVEGNRGQRVHCTASRERSSDLEWMYQASSPVGTKLASEVPVTRLGVYWPVLINDVVKTLLRE